MLGNRLYNTSKMSKNKILTEKNIESLGFVYLEKRKGKSFFINESECNRDERIYFGELIENKRYIVVENNCGQIYFRGWLKDINEFKKLLEQTNVGFRLDSN